MFIRIVKMSFEPSKVKLFLKNFNNNKQKIRNVKGCRLLELYNDRNAENVFFSYSYWESETDLENYRNSALFKGIWQNTKVLFNQKPEAWSVDKIESLP
ncbi:MAG TPA: antibiotic biosynthesis monooxygenase family protein [Flavobacteriaceae bacterium]|nr:antibiotic biosynthesis monooxygenase family protein [Flavobacteriaceae bacterium]